jgi:hypothetical protein
MVENGLKETPITPARRRTWVRSLLLGMVILLCGAVIGSVITAVALEQRPIHGIRRPDRLPERIAEDMRWKYKLTDEQERQIQAIFEEHGKKLSDIRAEVQPRVDAEHEALRRGVEAVLTPEQAGQWRQEYEHMRRLWHPRAGESPAPADRK